MSPLSQLYMPYQCMVKCGNILVAARGSRMDSFDIQNGSLLSTWNCPVSQEGKERPVPTEAQNNAASSSPVSPTGEVSIEDSDPPAKKRKLSSDPGSKEEEKTTRNDQISETKDGKKKDKKPKQNNRSVAVNSGLQAPAVIALAATKDGRNVIAVTGEDKSIRVFENVEENGTQRLQQISQRAMPKRPCSITLTPEDSTIISADKFGDVYSLPLIPSSPPSELLPSTPTPEPTLAKPFIPAANELTIHSQRNRKALENQKRQNNRPAEKSEPTFEHKLLLGHVSMLTDVAFVSVNERNYIVTADRDEHIRISRGIPQTHIIEGFCLGHTEFITRLCFPTGRKSVMLSGGGDEEVYVWSWLEGKLLSKGNLKKYVDVLRSGLEIFKAGEVMVETVKIAVSGISHVMQGVKDTIIVTCEGVPALFIFILTSQNELEHLQTLELPGNVLALASTTVNGSDTLGSLVVSVDTVHKPGSTTEQREDKTEELKSLLSYKFDEEKLVEDGPVFSLVEGAVDISNAAHLGNFLYNLENLRKREGDGGDE